MSVQRPYSAGNGNSRNSSPPDPSTLHERVAVGGRELFLRPIGPGDEADLRAQFEKLTPDDVRMRFFGLMHHMSPAMAARLTHIDYDREMALVLVDPPDADEGGRYGVVRLVADADFSQAEVAIVINPEHRGRGYARLLMDRILDYARRRGIQRICAEILAENRAMLMLVQSVGFELQRNPHDATIIDATLDLD